MPIPEGEDAVQVPEEEDIQQPEEQQQHRYERNSSSKHTENGEFDASLWPRPLSPLAGEEARRIELERALKAEAAMNSRAAFAAQDIVYEDEWLFVVNKPSGIYADHVRATVQSIISARASPNGDPLTPAPHLHLANRLDRDTSGLMIVTKCKVAAGILTRMFEKRTVKKTYVARCIGGRPVWNEMLVESGHGRSRWGAWRVYAKEDVGQELPLKAVVKEMATHFSILAVNGEKCSRCICSEGVCQRVVAKRDHVYLNKSTFRDELLLRAYPLTGRTHQVRLHCQFLGLPLVGDVKYGGPMVWKGETYHFHALHAESMSFMHPVTQAEMCLTAPLPNWAL